MEIDLDAERFLSLAESTERALEFINGGLGLGDLPSELIRLETDFSPAGAGKLTVRLEPSDSFLSFAIAVGARNLDFAAIQ